LPVAPVRPRVCQAATSRARRLGRAPVSAVIRGSAGQPSMSIRRCWPRDAPTLLRVPFATAVRQCSRLNAGRQIRTSLAKESRSVQSASATWRLLLSRRRDWCLGRSLRIPQCPYGFTLARDRGQSSTPLGWHSRLGSCGLGAQSRPKRKAAASISESRNQRQMLYPASALTVQRFARNR
jgi:hypothetical protein